MKILEAINYNNTNAFPNWPIHVVISFTLCFRNKIMQKNKIKQLAYLIEIIP